MKNKKLVYLDYAAATPMDPSVLKSMTPYFSSRFYNPSANYLEAKQISSDINAARASVAAFLGSKPNEIIFTSGGTEANNLAISGVMDKYPSGDVLVSSIEHESVIEPAKQYNYKLIPVNTDGTVDLVKLEKLISPKTVLISIMYANNEIGTVQPLRAVAKLLVKVRAHRELEKNNLPLYFHTDACQAPAYLDIHVSNLGVDLMTLNGGKIYGPKQSGVLFISRKLSLHPQILGGGQESGVRSGTENVANIIGFAKALDSAQTDYKNESKREEILRDILIKKILEVVPSSKINGTMRARLPNNISVTIPGKDNETMLMQLDERGIMCATGSACNARSNNASHVLLSIGLSENEARSSLRFSLGKHTKKSDISYVTSVFQELLG